MKSDLVIGMAGSGGDGVVSAGEALTAAAAAAGYHVIMTKSFGSQIRGGESSCRVRVSSRPIFGCGGTLDVAVALSWPDFLKFGGELPVGPDTVVLYDAGSGVEPKDVPLAGISPARILRAPIAEMSVQGVGNERARNVVVLGLLAGWLVIVTLIGVTTRVRYPRGEWLIADDDDFALRVGTSMRATRW